MTPSKIIVPTLFVERANPETSIEFGRLSPHKKLVVVLLTFSPLRRSASAEAKRERSIDISTFSLKIAVTLFFVTSLELSHEPISPLSSKRGFCKSISYFMHLLLRLNEEWAVRLH